MYFPYLRGRQAELRALQAAAADLGSPQVIFPIIEPVKAVPAKLLTTLQSLALAGNRALLVVNPHLDEFRLPSVHTAWQAAIATQAANPAVVTPVLDIRATVTAADVTAFAAAYPARPLALVVHDARLTGAQLVTALGASAPQTMFVLRDGVSATTFSSTVASSMMVEIVDNFNAQARNADYAGEEWLGNNHLTYAAAGFNGFGDYTVLPGTYTGSGGPAGAVAIHLTFKATPGSDFHVQHFVSDETDRNVSNYPTKLLEALNYLDQQVTSTPTKFQNSPALQSYLVMYAAGQSTNGSNSVSLQVRHHLFEVARHLGLQQ